MLSPLKVAFIHKVPFIFQISMAPKNIFQKTILSLKFEFTANNINQQIIFLETGRFEKHIARSEKKPPLVNTARKKN